VVSTTVLLLASSFAKRLARMTPWSAITRTRRSRSALAYGSRSTATADTTSSCSYTTSRDATFEAGAEDELRVQVRRERGAEFGRESNVEVRASTVIDLA